MPVHARRLPRHEGIPGLSKMRLCLVELEREAGRGRRLVRQGCLPSLRGCFGLGMSQAAAESRARQFFWLHDSGRPLVRPDEAPPFCTMQSIHHACGGSVKGPMQGSWIEDQQWHSLLIARYMMVFESVVRRRVSGARFDSMHHHFPEAFLWGPPPPPTHTTPALPAPTSQQNRSRVLEKRASAVRRAVSQCHFQSCPVPAPRTQSWQHGVWGPSSPIKTPSAAPGRRQGSSANVGSLPVDKGLLQGAGFFPDKFHPTWACRESRLASPTAGLGCA